MTADPARGGTVSSWLDRRARPRAAPARPGRQRAAGLRRVPAAPHASARARGTCCRPGRRRAGAARRPGRGPGRDARRPAQRLVVTGELDGVRYEQTLTVWTGLSRVDCTTRLRPTGADRLLRLRWPTDVPGGLPVSEVGAAVVGRGFGIVDVDSAEHPWTLDNPAYSWFGARARPRGSWPAGAAHRAIGVAEVVADAAVGAGVRDLVVALVRAGRHLDHVAGHRQPVRRARASTPTCPTPGSRSAARTATRSPRRCWPPRRAGTPPSWTGSSPRPAGPGSGCRPSGR